MKPKGLIVHRMYIKIKSIVCIGYLIQLNILLEVENWEGDLSFNALTRVRFPSGAKTKCERVHIYIIIRFIRILVNYLCYVCVVKSFIVTNVKSWSEWGLQIGGPKPNTFQLFHHDFCSNSNISVIFTCLCRSVIYIVYSFD